MPPYDALIVLGSNILPNGGLSPDSLARVKTGIQLFRKGGLHFLILSGKWSIRNEYVPPRTEAEAMKEAVLKQKIPLNVILLEKKSYDSVTNLVYCKRLLKKRRLKSCLVVTTDFHVPRIRLLSRYVFGKTIRFSVKGVLRKMSKYERAQREKHERKQISGLRNTLQSITPGNDRVMEKMSKDYFAGLKKKEIAPGRFELPSPGSEPDILVQARRQGYTLLI